MCGIVKTSADDDETLVETARGVDCDKTRTFYDVQGTTMRPSRNQPGHAKKIPKPASSPALGNADTMLGASGTMMLPAMVDNHADPDSAEALVGMRVGGRYQLLRVLGVGGMGTVYLARDNELDELIALKMLSAAMSDTSDAVDVLRQEVRLARRVTHRNVARIFELGEHEGVRYLTMEYVDGESLGKLIKSQGRLPLMRSLEILRAVCAGLQAVHDAKIIHRDIKPDNVLVAHSGRVLVSDFGIARVSREAGRLPSQTEVGDSQTYLMAGTPAYMSPEQLTGGAITSRSDIFSLGVMAFEMITGELPWKPLERSLGRLNTPPPDPRAIVAGLPEGITEVLHLALARIPEERIATPLAFAEKLHACAGVTASQLTKQAITLTTGGNTSDKHAVAVLPFQNRGNDEDSYLACGITEDLIDQLCSISDVRVLSHGATVRFVDDIREAHEIGQELGVQTVIQGSIERSGSQIQVRARAINTADGVQWWAKRYQVPAEALLGVLDEVTQSLAASLSKVAGSLTRRHAIVNPVAMEIYLRGRDAYRHAQSPASVLALFEEARRHDPDSPLINASYAMALLRFWMLSPRGDTSLVAKARDAAQTALTQAPTLGEPHLALGLLHLHLGDSVGAIREFRTAISMAPSMAEAHGFLGMLLAEMGRVPEALQRLDTANSLDPTMHLPNNDRRRLAALIGDWERAMRVDPRTALLVSSAGWMLNLRIASYRGDTAVLTELAATLANASQQGYGLERLMARMIDVYLGRAPVSMAYEDSQWIYTPEPGTSCRRLALISQLRAEVAGFANDIDEAIAAIDRGLDFGLIDLLWLDRCPLLDGVRQDIRFSDLRHRLLQRVHAAVDAMWL